MGTADYTTYLQKIIEAKPDIVMMAHWGVDAINVLKQANELGLGKKTKLWFNWMTNVFGSGVPAEALDGVYSLMSWYWNLEGLRTRRSSRPARSSWTRYPEGLRRAPGPLCRHGLRGGSGTPPRHRGGPVHRAPGRGQSHYAEAAVQLHEGGRATWREDHQPLFKYGAFVVQGKGAKDRKNKWDLVKVIDAYTGTEYLPSLKDEGY